MFRRSLCSGGTCVQGVLVFRWSLCSGGPCVQVILMFRWSLCSGGPCVQVVLMFRWSLCSGGPCVQVVLATYPQQVNRLSLPDSHNTQCSMPIKVLTCLQWTPCWVRGQALYNSSTVCTGLVLSSTCWTETDGSSHTLYSGTLVTWIRKE